LPENQKTQHRYGLVKEPYDRQYEAAAQPKHPINEHNMNAEDDFRNVYNPSKGPNKWPNSHEDMRAGNYYHPYDLTVSRAQVQNEWSHDDLPENQKTQHRYGLVKEPYDRQYEAAAQPKHPINEHNMNAEDDFRNVYNPSKGPNKWPNSHEDMRAGNYYHPYDLTVSRAQITPTRRDGLVPPTPDYQYGEVFQPRKPLIEQQMHDEDDLRNVYNPNIKHNFWPSSGEDIRHTGRNGLNQITPTRRDGLVPPTPDYQYGEVFQPRKPLIEQQMHDEDDLRNVYNPNIKHNFWPSSGEDIRHTGRNGLAQIRDANATAATTASNSTAPAAAAAATPAASATDVGCKFPPGEQQYPQPNTITDATDCDGFKIKNEPSSSAAGRTPSLAQRW